MGTLKEDNPDLVEVFGDGLGCDGGRVLRQPAVGDTHEDAGEAP
ncbi:hypothetical protein ACWD4J_40910 [Streptomyces sp. NPDC002577]